MAHEKLEVTIRMADRKDSRTVAEFIRGLAEFEKLAHEMVATEELVIKNVFENKYAEVLIAESSGMPVGYALFFHNFSTFLSKPGIYLEDLFVKPEFRGKGVGKRLLVRLARIAKERDCGRFEWAVLNWNKGAIDFYESLGAKAMDEWTVYRLTGAGLDAVADLEA